MAESVAVAPNFLSRLRNVNYKRLGETALVIALVAGCSADDNEESRAASTTTASASPSAAREGEVKAGGMVELKPHREVTNTASGLDCDTSDLPEIPEGLVLVDGRCDAQGQDIPVGVHIEPTQLSEGLATVPNGTILELTDEACAIAGENIINSNAVGSAQWVAVKLDSPHVASKSAQTAESGYIPGAWVHGEENLETCPS